MIRHPSMANGGNPPDLPQEVLAVLPSDPYEQLDVARRITSLAISSRLSQLESETGRLREKLSEKEQIVFSLETRVGELEQALQDASSRLSQALDEQEKLATEKDSLAASVKKLTRDVAKLETFKRALMQSLQEDDEVSTQSGTVEKTSEIATQNRSTSTTGSMNAEADVSSSQMQSQDYRNSSSGLGLSTRAVSLKYSSLQSDDIQFESDVSKSMLAQAYSLTPPRLTPQLTPTGSPKKQSGASSPRQYSASGSPRQHSTYDLRSSFSSSQPTSKRTTAPNSPPKGPAPVSATRTPRVDGKEFFRQARTRLSYEQFSAFLANIKELNAHRQTREETLRKADEIFGPENKDLYQSFEGLLTRHLPAQPQ